MKCIKRLLSILFCIIINVSMCCFSVSAAEEKTFELTLSATTAVPGDTVVFNLDVKNNPGIMAATFTLHYDPEVLEYEKYIAGILSRDTSARHDGYVSFVFCGASDRVGDGTLYGFQFKVKDTAKAGFSAVTIKNIHSSQYGDSLKGCFANWIGDRLLPTITSGGVDIGYTGSNCDHKFGEWETVVPAGCKTAGVRSHICAVCGHNAQEEIPAIGHIYEENWTIDRAATSLNDGVMSRHCTGPGCESTDSQLVFTLRDAEGNGFSNTVGTVIEPGSWEPLKEIIEQIKEQEQQKDPDGGGTVAVVPEETPDVSAPEPDDTEITEEIIDENELPIAEELVITAKKEDSTLVKLHSYLFGTDEQTGIISMLSDGLNKAAAGAFKLWPLLLMIVMCVFIL